MIGRKVKGRRDGPPDGEDLTDRPPTETEQVGRADFSLLGARPGGHSAAELESRTRRRRGTGRPHRRRETGRGRGGRGGQIFPSNFSTFFSYIIIKAAHTLARGVQPFGVSDPPWKKKSYLGPPMKYTNTNKNS